MFYLQYDIRHICILHFIINLLLKILPKQAYLCFKFKYKCPIAISLFTNLTAI